jgi:Mg2+ and Co2+ transporter CorA
MGPNLARQRFKRIFLTHAGWPGTIGPGAWAEDFEKSEPSTSLVRGMLYDADGHDREIQLADALPPLTARQLLWVDVQGSANGELQHIGERLKLPPSMRSVLLERSSRSQLAKSDGHIHLGIPALQSGTKGTETAAMVASVCAHDCTGVARSSAFVSSDIHVRTRTRCSSSSSRATANRSAISS